MFEDKVLRKWIIISIVALVIVILILTQPGDTLLSRLTPQASTILYYGILTFYVGAAIWLGFKLWQTFKQGETLKTVWIALVAGLLLWGFAELYSAYFEAISGVEPPYPSIADGAWLLGYIPFMIGLYLRYRSLGIAPTRGQILTILGILTVFAVVALIFVIVPIIAWPYESALEKAIEIGYPSLDVLLAIPALFVMLVLAGGKMARTWTLIAVGFLVFSLSDLLFTYTSWQETYLYEGVNFITVFVDTTHIAAYIIVFLGFMNQVRTEGLLDVSPE